jgi:hypothetical protein
MPHQLVRYIILHLVAGYILTHKQVTIKGVTYGGTGCPQGTMSSQISEDRTTVTLIFDSYIASIGPGISVTDSRKNCQLNVDIRYPGGFQYSILSADYRGYASLQQGISGTLKSTYYFAGQTAQVSFLSTDSSVGIYADDSIVQHAIRLRRPPDRRLPQARHGRQHFGRLVAVRRKRSAQHQLPGPPRQH